MLRRLRAGFVATLAGVVLAVPGPAVAGQPIDVTTLNPVPPAWFTCKATGSGAICTGSVAFDVSGPTGILCGDDSNPVELVTVNATDSEDVTRFFNVNGDITRRIIQETIESTWVDPATQLSVRNRQVVDSTITYLTPGDLSTGVHAVRGVNKWWGPGVGVVLMDVGREVLGPPDDSDLLVSVGKHPLDQLFLAGDTSVLAQLCAALGSPGTPPLP